MKQQQLIFRTWGGRRKGAGRKRHTDELPHVARPEVRPGQPQHVTIRVRPDVISLRKSKSFAAIKQAFRLARERLGIRLCHFSVQGSRVAPAVARRGSHGSGRADLPHPALQ